MDTVHQGLKISQGAIVGMNSAVVGYIIAVIDQRGGKDRE